MEPVGVAFATLGTADICLKSVSSRLFLGGSRTSYEHAFRSHFTESMTREHVPSYFYRSMIGNINMRHLANAEQIWKRAYRTLSGLQAC